MAKQTVLVSDLTGEPIKNGEAVQVRLAYADSRKGVVVLDARAEEVAELAAKGRRQEKRGRKTVAA